MFESALGGAKGEPGKYLERHSRGRGRMNKATRTLWLVTLCFTTRMPCPQFSKTPAKIGHFLIHTPKVCTAEDSGCLPPTTPSITKRRQAAALQGGIPISDWPDPQSETAFSLRFPLLPSRDKAWHRRPRPFPLYQGVPTKV